MRLLGECSVLEIGQYVAVPYAGKLLSDLGATVTKIEPPEGDVARRVGPFGGGQSDLNSSEFFGFLNTGKRSLTVPPEPESSSNLLHDLISEYQIDIVIQEDLSGYGVTPSEITAKHDDVSVVSVSGFGATGPWKEYDAPDLIAWAESGHMNKMGYADSPPTRIRFKTADYWAGQMAAISGLAAHLSTKLQETPGQHVDLSKREVGVSSLEYYIAGYSWSGLTTSRVGDGYPEQGSVGGVSTIHETADGYVSASPFNPEDFNIVATELMEQPELLEDERFATVEAREEHEEELADVVEEWMASQEKWELFEKLQQHGFPCGVTSSPADVTNFDHLTQRDFWQELILPDNQSVTAPGFPFTINGNRPHMKRAPRLDEHTDEIYTQLGYDRYPGPVPDNSTTQEIAESSESKQTTDTSLPLEGIKVVDFSWVYAGPHTSRLLAAFGADVVKIESRQKPDSARGARAYHYDPEPTDSVSALYNEMNQGKRAITLDLTNEHGQSIAMDLVREADILLENFSPTFPPRVGLDYDSVTEINPDIIYLSMSGWGRSGPAKNYRAYGITVQSMAGLDWVSGHPEGPPTTAGFSWADPTNAHQGLFAVLAAVAYRERTGEGCHIQSPLLEITASMGHKPLMEFLNHDRLPDRVGNRDEDGQYVQGAYPCEGEDNWAVVAVGSNSQWASLCQVIDRPELRDDPRFADHADRLQNHDVIDEVVEEWTKKRSREEVRERLQCKGVPAGIVANERDLVDYDPQLRVRGYFTIQDHPEVGEQTYQGIPFKMQLHDIEFRDRAPLFGEHTDEVLSEWLNLSRTEIEAAKDSGALF